MSDGALTHRLLEASLPHVPFDAWSEKALKAAARDLNLSEAEATTAFPGGARDLVAAFAAWGDAQMLVELAKSDLSKLKFREKVALAVRLRLEALAPHREAVRRYLAFLALPGNAALGLRLLAGTVDEIWAAVGDKTTDYNWYSKRLLLGGVIATTTLHWLSDESEGSKDSWAFLNRRIDQVIKVGGTFGKGFGDLLNLPDRLLKRVRGKSF